MGPFGTTCASRPSCTTIQKERVPATNPATAQAKARASVEPCRGFPSARRHSSARNQKLDVTPVLSTQPLPRPRPKDQQTPRLMQQNDKVTPTAENPKLGPDQRCESIGRGASGRHLGPARGDQFAEAETDKMVDQILLRGKVCVKRSLTHVSSLGDVLDGGLVQSAGCNDCEPGLDQTLEASCAAPIRPILLAG
jgi:hypothetical protein